MLHGDDCRYAYASTAMIGVYNGTAASNTGACVRRTPRKLPFRLTARAPPIPRSVRTSVHEAAAVAATSTPNRSLARPPTPQAATPAAPATIERDDVQTTHRT